MNKHVTRIVLAVVFVLGLLALDRMLGYALGRAMESVQSGETIGAINRALAHDDSEIVVFGSSRALHHIDPAILTEELGVTAYNAGANGQGILYSRMLESLLMERGTGARIFVVQTDVMDLFDPREDRARIFAPFVDEDSTVAAILTDGWRMKVKLRFHTYRYNSLVLPVLRNLLLPREDEGNGFLPLHETYRDREDEQEAAGERPTAATEWTDVDPELVEQIREFIRAARHQGIQVALVVGPRFRRSSHLEALTEDAISRFRLIAEEEGAELLWLDERHYPVFTDQALYRDRSHLNAEGAAIFSRILARELAPVLTGPDTQSPGARAPAATAPPRNGGRGP